MNSPGQRAPRPAVRRRHVLCVLGLLAGLLGMHGLAPGGGLPRPMHTQQAAALHSHTPQAHTPQSHTPQAHTPQSHTPQAHTPQSHTPQAHTPRTPVLQAHLMPYGHCGEGHVQHADASCASGAVGGGPVLPPLVQDPVPVVEGESAVRAYAVADTDGARAPPSLAELQLLRI
ncbi:DUF6153 family protein [Streptomyces sp. NPDC016172]|uniref:DUF6153 family protein n=1 Tax=Streptomyces sp. NPDC016172 TaxID=3364964 RepID=UPI0036F67FA9